MVETHENEKVRVMVIISYKHTQNSVQYSIRCDNTPVGFHSTIYFSSFLAIAMTSLWFHSPGSIVVYHSPMNAQSHCPWSVRTFIAPATRVHGSLIVVYCHFSRIFHIIIMPLGFLMITTTTTGLQQRQPMAHNGGFISMPELLKKEVQLFLCYSRIEKYVIRGTE